MLPGGQRALNQMGGNLDEGIFDKNEAIIMSMTKDSACVPPSSTVSVARVSPRELA